MIKGGYKFLVQLGSLANCPWQTIFLICALALLLAPQFAMPEALIVNSYYGQYDANRKKPGFPSASLASPKTETWQSVKPAKQYHIGVLLPHLNDSYWETTNYGIVAHARELGLKITVYLAGSYSNLGNQGSQLKALIIRDKVDGIILGSVDYTKMDPFVAKAGDAGVPVVALINDVYAPAITAKSMVSFHEMGYKAGEFVMEHAGSRDFRVAFLPGPQESGWAPDTFDGFRQAVSERQSKGQRIDILPPLYGDTRKDVQQMRLDILNKKEYAGVDYLVGNAVAAVEAVTYLKRQHNKHPNAKIVATYLTSRVFEQIEEGLILAAPSDQIVSQCRIAVDMVVRTLNGEKAGRNFPFRASPLIPLITTDNIGQFVYEHLFGNRDFQPVYTEFSIDRLAE